MDRFDWESEELPYKVQSYIEALEKRVGELLKAAEYVRDDLLLRAEKRNGEKVVAIGAGAWIQFNNAIDTARGEEQDNE